MSHRALNQKFGFQPALSGKAPPRPTTVLFGHDDRAIYVAFLCDGQREPKSQDRQRDGDVWEDDAVEVFLRPPGSEAYHHFALDSAGVQYEARCAGGIDQGWNGEWQAKTGRTAEGWIAEIAIPWSTLGARAEGLWRANFGREEADTAVASSWSPTFGAGFHEPGRFGEVAF